MAYPHEDAAPIVGERVALPSGEKVRVTAAGDSARPWQAIELGHSWQVIRLNYDLVVAHATHSFGGSRHPKQFDKADAEALAKLLNRARP
jgi:hypothetical protein